MQFTNNLKSILRCPIKSGMTEHVTVHVTVL